MQVKLKDLELGTKFSLGGQDYIKYAISLYKDNNVVCRLILGGKVQSNITEELPLNTEVEVK
jgi:hypothetical protein